MNIPTAIIFSFISLVGFYSPNFRAFSGEPVGTLLGSSELVNSLSAFSGSADVAKADTLDAGDTFITVLPDSLNQRPVIAYSAKQLPLMSWLRGRSFFWKTSSKDVGLHSFRFLAELQDTDEPNTDEYVFQVDVFVKQK